MDNDRIRQRAERRYHDERVADTTQGTAPTSDELLEELRIHQIELEIQNEELRNAQQEAEDARQRFFRLYELAPVGYVTVRPDGRILSANLAMCEMTGFDHQSLTRSGLFGLVDTDDRPSLIHVLKHVVAVVGERVAADVTLAGEGGRRVHVEAIRHDGDTDLAQEIQLSFTDVTREKEAEDRARAEAEHNQLLLRELNHRVKNNLQLLLSLVMLQRRRASDESVCRALAAFEDRVRALTFSHQTLKPGATQGGADVVELLSTLATQFNAHHKAEIRFSATRDELLVDGDTALSLALVANELISNSLKYGTRDETSGVIDVRVEADATPAAESRTLRLKIADTGPGFPPELLTDAGSQRSGSQKAEGGLGFMLVGQLAEQQLGGTWTRRNHENGGAEHVIEVSL